MNPVIIKKIDESKRINGKDRGLFANRNWEPNTIIMQMVGKTIKRSELTGLTKDQQDNLLQIGTDLFIDLTKENGSFSNHRCHTDANAYVKIAINNAFLVSLRPIAKGDEITFDYSLTSTDNKDDWNMSCGCNRFYCRKVISGFQELPDKVKQEYIKLNIVPNHILKTIK